jgi:hypothetical protein
MRKMKTLHLSIIVGVGIIASVSISFLIFLHLMANTSSESVSGSSLTSQNTTLPRYILANSTNDTSFLHIYLTTNSTVLRSGQTIRIDLVLNNTSQYQLIAKAQNRWSLQGLRLDPCRNAMPFGVTLLQGNYSPENMMQAKPISFYDIGTVMCSMIQYDHVDYYLFQSLSDKAISEVGDQDFNGDMSYVGSFNGFFDANDTFHKFAVGQYTIVGGDEWGHITIQHFTVQ